MSAQTAELEQASLLAMAFSTPFTLSDGTGGYAQVQHIVASGNSLFVLAEKPPSEEEVKRAVFAQGLNKLMQRYGLTKSQLAWIFNVSRPTIYSWLDENTQKIDGEKSRRLARVIEFLDGYIASGGQEHLGGLLNKKLDPAVSDFVRLVASDEVEEGEISAIMRALNFRLSGIDVSNKLSKALENKKVLI